MSSCLPREDRADFAYHLSLLELDESDGQSDEALLAPVLTGAVLNQPSLGPTQYGLLGGVKRIDTPSYPTMNDEVTKNDPRLFFNVSSPSSVFICGSQGTGKSHTLSCLLEGCLIPSKAGRLLSPLTVVVFHYDTFICDGGGSPCEAAFLSSRLDLKVRVLCAPTNLRTIKIRWASITEAHTAYNTTGFNIEVQPLQTDQSHLNTKRMLDLMSVARDSGAGPLYLQTVQRILREMRLLQQSTGLPFDYQDFKTRVLGSGLLTGQLEPLKQRLNFLESFMPPHQASTGYKFKKTKAKTQDGASNWAPKLTIVDLSCPCVSPDTACSLFNICFEIFMEQDTNIGRIVALDEAQKYMKDSVEAQNFIDTLLSTVRLQRHLGARIFVSTQEPTISSDLLDLCSVAIVHRFPSPAWVRALQPHVAAAALNLHVTKDSQAKNEQALLDIPAKLSIFHRIVNLKIGEALLFSPGAMLSIVSEEPELQEMVRLGSGYMTIKVRGRLTDDGGKSVLST
ncbi:hypothetical protein N7539_008801 [Penicillium diatomitis]|uniref:P-loop containing nucleoside triphosphate hydrolase protein n=1 Tax=Penicillium diatomitis TaxID=2819901 RepID=A0A9W9WR85_9EURO|nr:uncharacterized protein N7539_008801 [Penicillium diatomitis]KAJ5471858.1 hypothetical protein N7539_008801 [Penicillium diatomitis]